MASITIRGLEDSVKQRLRMRAAEHGRSMEEEAREILRCGVATQPLGLARIEKIRARFAKYPGGGVVLPEFPDQPLPPPRRFK